MDEGGNLMVVALWRLYGRNTPANDFKVAFLFCCPT